jgi:hypothetical protein
MPVNSIAVGSYPLWVLYDALRSRCLVFSDGSQNTVTTIATPGMTLISQLSTGVSPQMASYSIAGPCACVDGSGNVWAGSGTQGLSVWDGTTFGAPIHTIQIQTSDGSGSPIFPYGSLSVVNLPLRSLAYWTDSGGHGHVIGICSESRVSSVNSSGASMFSINPTTYAVEWYTTAITSPPIIATGINTFYPAIDPSTGNIYLTAGRNNSGNWYFWKINAGTVVTHTHAISGSLGEPMECLFDSTTGHVWSLSSERDLAAFGYEVDPSTGNILSTVGSAGSSAFAANIGGPTAFAWPNVSLQNAIRAQNGIAGSTILLYNASSIPGPDPTLSYFSTALAPTQNFDLTQLGSGSLTNLNVGSFAADLSGSVGIVYLLTATGSIGAATETLYAIPLQNQVMTPNVVGQTQSTAIGTLTGVGLTLGTVSSAFSLLVPAGIVLSQTPVPTTLVNLGSSVDVIESSGRGVSFTFQDASGAPIAFGTLSIRLNTDVVVLSGDAQVAANRLTRVTLDDTGSCTIDLWPNDQLSPPNSVYLVRVNTVEGLLVWDEQTVVNDSGEHTP